MQSSQSREAQSDHDLQRMRHSAAHLMAAAIQKLWPTAKFGVGPARQDGFYYDVDLPESLTPEDLGRIEQVMSELKRQNLSYERIDTPIDQAIAEMSGRSQPYKAELLNLL